MISMVLVFFFKQKTAYEMRISDWSSDVCSSDLPHGEAGTVQSVQQLRFAGGGITPARLHAARLIAAKVRAGRNLAIGILTRQPDFQIVGACRRETQVATTQQHGAIGQI